jgi:hypothetical protein
MFHGGKKRCRKFYFNRLSKISCTKRKYRSVESALITGSALDNLRFEKLYFYRVKDGLYHRNVNSKITDAGVRNMSKYFLKIP